MKAVNFCVKKEERRTHLSDRPAGRPLLRTPQAEAFLEPPCIRIQSLHEDASADRTHKIMCYFLVLIACYLLVAVWEVASLISKAVLYNVA